MWGKVGVKGTRYMVEARWRQTKGSCMCCILEVSSKLIQVIRYIVFLIYRTSKHLTKESGMASFDMV